jgi:hypothetical protein
MRVGGVRRRLPRRLPLVLALVVVAAGLSVWAWRARAAEPFCWGAWEERDNGPWVVGGDIDSRSVTETAPTPEDPHGSCVVTGEDEDRHYQAELSYGPVPAEPDTLTSWIGVFLNGDAVPLPEGLPGTITRDGGMLLLPPECDLDGRPTAVTLTGVGSGERYTNVWSKGQLLTEAARHGMAAAGCDAEPPSFTAPFTSLSPEQRHWNASPPVCGIQRLGPAEVGAYAWGGTRDDFQACGRNDAEFQLVMAGRPQLTEVFEPLLGTEALVAEADCDGRRTVYYGRAAEEEFPVFIRAVAQRLGCEPPVSAADEGGTA